LCIRQTLSAAPLDLELKVVLLLTQNQQFNCRTLILRSHKSI